jgi:hypothetical protein
VDDDMAKVFAATVKKKYDTHEFEHGSYASEYAQRRDDVIEQVLAGAELEMPEMPVAKDETPDLMAMLQAELDEDEDETPVKKPAKKAKVAA